MGASSVGVTMDGAGARGRAVFGMGALLAVLGVGLTLRMMLRVNVDVAWLLTVGEKVLDGERLYVDVLETNPPASVLIYWPAILMARLAGLAPERVLDLLVFAGTGLSLWLAGVALAGAGLLRGVAVWFLAPCAAAVLLIVPLDNIAQREHIAVVAVLPALAVMAARAEGYAPPPWIAILAGLGAGVTVAIKPHFLLGLALPELYVVWRLRSLRIVLRLENLAAAALVLAYAAVVVAAFPAFLTDMMPLLSDVYLSVRYYDLAAMLTMPATPIWLATGAGIMIAARPRDWDAPLVVPYLASAGFLAALLIQGKGWSYHGYPAVALAFLTAAIAVARIIDNPGERRDAPLRRALQTAVSAGFVLMACWGTPWFRDGRDLGTLASVLARLTPRPKLIAVSSDLSIGHPLVREIGGSWVGRVCSQWITSGVVARQDEELDEATRARLATHAERDKAMLAADIRDNRPDIILIHLDWYDWMKWMLSDPGLVEALSQYRRRETVGEVAIWSRDANQVAEQDFSSMRGAGEHPSVEAPR